MDWLLTLYVETQKGRCSQRVALSKDVRLSAGRLEIQVQQCLLSRLLGVECLLVGWLQVADWIGENKSSNLVLNGWQRVVGDGGGRR